jgi:hypothetical protein
MHSKGANKRFIMLCYCYEYSTQSSRMALLINHGSATCDEMLAFYLNNLLVNDLLLKAGLLYVEWGYAVCGDDFSSKSWNPPSQAAECRPPYYLPTCSSYHPEALTLG